MRWQVALIVDVSIVLDQFFFSWFLIQDVSVSVNVIEGDS